MNESASRRPGRVLAGVAGWSYKDWEGVVYPSPLPRNFDPLSYLAEFLDVIEINSTFYNPGPAKNAEAWAKRVSGNPGFIFTVKLWQKFTHQLDGQFTEEDVAAASAIPSKLAEHGLLGAVLVQFPWSFKNGEVERGRLMRILESFSSFPLAVEVRHASWDAEPYYEILREKGAAAVNMDLPLTKTTMKSLANVTAPHAYLRLHGRNYRHWFDKEAGRDQRYDYLYSEQELRPWKGRIERMAKEAEKVYVIANNHFRGQAVANALMIMGMTGREIRPPEPLSKAFPRLGFDVPEE